MSILKVGMYASQSRGANYLTFSSDNPFSISFTAKHWDGVLEYSLDAQHWYEWDASEIYSSGNVLYLRGSGNSYITGALDLSYAMQITATSGVECTGNIMSLLSRLNPENAVMANAAFACLFYGQDKLITSPELPATQLADSCYRNMYSGCSGITTAPELPATTLAESCYRAMLESCTNLAIAPELPATTLAEYCYYYMLSGCTKIKISSTQTGVYQKLWRIPTTGTISNNPTSWNLTMLRGTGGTFTSNPSINTTYYQAT